MLLVVLISMLVSAACSAAAFAWQSGWGEVVTAEPEEKWGTVRIEHFDSIVSSRDMASHQFVIESPGGKVLILRDDYAELEQEYGDAEELKIGERVSGSYKTIGTTNYATFIRSK